MGRVSSLAAFFATLGYSVTQILQVLGWINNPWDDILIYAFSLCISLPFLSSVIALHYTVDPGRKIWSHLAVSLSTMYTIFAVIVYTVQLAIVIPDAHPIANDAVLSMTPHSLFWTFDALAYLLMGLVTACLVPALRHQSRAKWLRIFLAAHACMTPVIAFEYFYPDFSPSLLWLASPWILTACGSMFLMYVYFSDRYFSIFPEADLRRSTIELPT